MMPTLLTILLLSVGSQSAAPSGASTPDARVVAEQQLALGIAQLQAIDVEAAVTTLRGVTGPLPLERVILLHENLGVALAYADRSAEAEQAFEDLLRVAPGHVLDYTISPKATFVFEKVRRRVARQSAAAIELDLPRSTPFDSPLTVGLRCTSNPAGLIRVWRLCHRVKSQGGEFVCDEQPAHNEAQALQFALPPIAAPLELQQGDELLQIAVSGHDVAGNEVFRDPDRRRPKELPLGVQAPQAWYQNPWVWTAAGTVVAASVAGLVTALWILQPDTARLETEVL